MWPDDMTSKKIYVIDKSTGEKIEGKEYSFASKLLTVRYTAGFVAGGSYTIKIERVRNIGGAYTTEEYSKDFAVTGGVFAKLTNITQNDTAVNNVSSLVSGAAKINLKYANTRDSAPMLHIMVGYYKNGDLVSVDLIKTSALQETRSINYEIPYIVPSISVEYDEVQIMVLDSFDNLKPLSAPVTIK